MQNSRAIGADYERQAAQYLETLGYEILARNFRCRLGEVDLVAKDGRYFVFVEVKYRSGHTAGTPQEAVTYKKQRTICKVAAYYCMKHGISQQCPCRFDVAAYSDGKWTIIKNAFDYVPL